MLDFFSFRMKFTCHQDEVIEFVFMSIAYMYGFKLKKNTKTHRILFNKGLQFNYFHSLSLSRLNMHARAGSVRRKNQSVKSFQLFFLSLYPFSSPKKSHHPHSYM